jgi:glutathione synthase/RimK-type ligase-like ATP-grasp enzyme
MSLKVPVSSTQPTIVPFSIQLNQQHQTSPIVQLSPPLSDPSPKISKERAIIQIFKQIAKEYGFGMTAVCEGDWLVKFTYPKNNTSGSVLGFNFDLNGAAAAKACDDKYATAEALAAAGVPVIEHEIFMKDNNEAYVSSEGSFMAIYTYTKKYNDNVVLKPVSESGGKGVTLAKNKRGINTAVQELFHKYHSICISPYYEINSEVRVIMLNGEPQVVYEKTKPHLVGNGKSTVLELYISWARSNPAFQQKIEMPTDWDNVLKNKEILNLGWKHNLCNGATAKVLSPKDPEVAKIVEIALSAVKVLGITFCSVDVAKIANGDLKVMEVNAGVMMNNLIKQYGDQGHQLAKRIYEKAICMMLRAPFRKIDEEIDLSLIDPSENMITPISKNKSLSSSPSYRLSHPNYDDSPSSEDSTGTTPKGSASLSPSPPSHFCSPQIYGRSPISPNPSFSLMGNIDTQRTRNIEFKNNEWLMPTGSTEMKEPSKRSELTKALSSPIKPLRPGNKVNQSQFKETHFYSLQNNNENQNLSRKKK